MEFREFTESIKEIVEALTDYTCVINDVPKNNGLILTGLTIKSDSTNIAPTIYLNDFYKDYTSGKSLQNITDEILSIHKKNSINRNINMDFFLKYENVKSKLCCKLINKDKNKVKLNSMPHTDILDLSIIYYVLILSDDLGTASIEIKNEHMALWGVTTEQLHTDAMENTERINKYQVYNIIEAVKRSMENDGMSDEEIDFLLSMMPPQVPMYVLTNTSKLNGAICMLYTDILKDFAEAVESDLIVIPSSIHECIVLPTIEDMSSDEVREMIATVNNNEMSADEILSYNSYYYNRNVGSLTIYK